VLVKAPSDSGDWTTHLMRKRTNILRVSFATVADSFGHATRAKDGTKATREPA
jgi:hypothetical protein